MGSCSYCDTKANYQMEDGLKYCHKHFFTLCIIKFVEKRKQVIFTPEEKQEFMDFMDAQGNRKTL